MKDSQAKTFSVGDVIMYVGLPFVVREVDRDRHDGKTLFLIQSEPQTAAFWIAARECDLPRSE